MVPSFARQAQKRNRMGISGGGYILRSRKKVVTASYLIFSKIQYNSMLIIHKDKKIFINNTINIKYTIF